MKNFYAFILILLLVVIAGCSSSNSDAPLVGGGGAAEQHPANWQSIHSTFAKADLRSCQGCHGFDFAGSGNAISCLTCHADAPPFTPGAGHPASWNADPLNGHQLNFQGALSDQTAWTSCATTACHGTALAGGDSGPSCQTAGCHTTGTNGWPPAPADHATFTPQSNGNHGLAAKGATDPTLSMVNYCLLCHGENPTSSAPVFDGGFVTSVIGNVNGNCSAALCHPTATAHPGNWASTRAGNSINHNDGTLTTGIQSESCAACHTTTGAAPASPFTGAPTCFDSTYSGLNCHATGPGGAPHAVPYTDPALHGPAAKAGLTGCQLCHGTVGGAGSNPRFNVPKGSMTNGCEDCHIAGAHPTRMDRWTFNLDTNHDVTGEVLTRRTHFSTSSRVTTDCVLCHNVTASYTGGTAPACNTCHASTTTFTLNCTFCHETPPSSGTPNLTGATLVDHAVGTDVTTIPNHEDCSICHGASESTTTAGTLAAKTTDYVLFGGTGQGGNHLDGNIEVNTAVGYQDVTATVSTERFGCSAACHPNDTTHQLSNSGLATNFGNYTIGTVACTDCHGYPPDGTSVAQGATSVDHTAFADGGADLLAQHAGCQTCHGNRENPSTPGTHDPLTNYVPGTNHYNGQINMNVDTLYSKTGPGAGGCDNAVCHANDTTPIDHRLPNVSGLPVEDGAYGTGSCTTCHDYPPKGDKIPLTAPANTTPVSHMGSDGTGAILLANHGGCQTCHGTRESTTSPSTHDPVSPYVPGTHHRDDKVEMNSDAGYNTANNGCDLSCHGNTDALHRLSSAAPGLTLQSLALGMSGACDSCHGGLPTDTANFGPIASNAHTAHISSLNSVSLECIDCHGHNGSGATHNEGGGTVIAANVDIDFTSGLGNGGSYAKATTKECSNIYCHGSFTPDWDAGVAIQCGDCHGAAGSGVTGGRPDDPSKPSGGNHLSTTHAAQTCDSCHQHNGTNSAESRANHVNGSPTANTNGDAEITTTGTNSLITTHNYGVVGTGSPDTDGFRYSASTCSSNNAACHGTASWGATGGCNFCHGYPPSGTNHASGFTAVNHISLLTGNHDDCSYCHGVKESGTVAGTMESMAISVLGGNYTYSQTLDHQDGFVTMNGPSGTGAGYNASNGGCDNGVCHSNDVDHQVGTGNAGALSTKDFGPGLCSSCHDIGVNSAPIVKSNSTHVVTTVGGAYGDCTDCHSGHYASGTGVQIPNNATVGLSYNKIDHGGVMLGGTETSIDASIRGLTTEAEICWGCHDQNGDGDLNDAGDVSEWGLNTDTNGGEPNYNFGTLNQANWTTASWTSGTAMFTYKTGAVESTHTANDVDVIPTAPGVDPVAAIRCSYCHNVHFGTNGDGSTVGAPYLRGTWMGNPYPEDGAPQSASSYTSSNSYRFGAVPRGNSGTPPRATGGYFIDQNRTTTGAYLNATTWSVANNAGLCLLCHTTDINGSNVNVDSMNYYGTASTAWVGTNGHSNAVIGGSGSNKSNIFDLRGGTRANSTNPAMAFQGASEPGDNGNFGFRNGEKKSDNWAPLLNGAPGELKRYQDYSWGATVDTSTTDTQYHRFSCSKCHNPHASRLPRLMVTNCLDTRHNSWDDSQGTRNLSQYGSNNTGRHKSNLTSAQNCHRVGDASESGTGAGWNSVTPW